jgi:hypothetical protein
MRVQYMLFAFLPPVLTLLNEAESTSSHQTAVHVGGHWLQLARLLKSCPVLLDRSSPAGLVYQ